MLRARNFHAQHCDISYSTAELKPRSGVFTLPAPVENWDLIPNMKNESLAMKCSRYDVLSVLRFTSPGMEATVLNRYTVRIDELGITKAL